MTVVPVDPVEPDPRAIAEAAAVLRAGGLVAFPTETVYGLGADACHADAVRRIFVAKGRPADNPCIVHIAATDALDGVAAHVPDLARTLAARWWPGPLTLIVDAAPSVPSVTTGGLRTVGVRVPAHPVALALLRAAGMPVAAPSANRSGRPSPTTAAHVLHDLVDAVDLVLDGGPCGLGVESTVVDARFAEPVVLREGSVTREDLGIAPDTPFPRGRARAPGTRHPHYAPACRVDVAPIGEAGRRAAALSRGGVRVGLVATEPAAPATATGVVGIATFDDARDLARILYDALRAAEQAAVDVVVIEAVPEVGVGRAVMDRLRRAAAG